MKTQVIVGRTLAVGAVFALFAAYIGACSSERPQASSEGGGGESPAASSASGTGGDMPDASVNSLDEACDDLCGYLGSIECNAWPNCSTECASGFNAPPQCADEVQALINCWVMNKMTFTCSMTQLLPPASCQALEAAFNECFTGTMPMPPEDGGKPVTCQQGQTKNATATTCSAKSPCDDMTEVKSYCSLPDGSQTWACSCYKETKLLGTCSATMDVCENYKGCCGAFFFPGKMP